MIFHLPVSVKEIICHFAAGSEIIVHYHNHKNFGVYLVVRDGLVRIEGSPNIVWRFFDDKASFQPMESPVSTKINVLLNTEENIKKLKLEEL